MKQCQHCDMEYPKLAFIGGCPSCGGAYKAREVLTQVVVETALEINPRKLAIVGGGVLVIMIVIMFVSFLIEADILVWV